MIEQIAESRGKPLFLGLDHIGVYATPSVSAQEAAEWYRERFGFTVEEGTGAFLLSGTEFGRIEIVKAASDASCHLAVRVPNYEKAVAALRAQGVEFDEPRRYTPEAKMVVLRDKDPLGNSIHLLWKA
ncbi:MAG: VOC family protein [Chloroflexi bacterium]|nr:VOC family protein [Chloroflexota bacterium]